MVLLVNLSSSSQIKILLKAVLQSQLTARHLALPTKWRMHPRRTKPPLPTHQTCATYGYPSAQTSFPRAPVKISPRPYCASLRENPATDVVCDNIWKDGHWEPSLTVSMILDLGWPLANRNLFIDVGGNIGYFTSLVASLGKALLFTSTTTRAKTIQDCTSFEISFWKDMG